jgi:uncharacterized secreted repeat protein (TIGR03808 family)
MTIDRRRLFVMSALSSTVPASMLIAPAAAAPLSSLGVDATSLGVRAGGGAEQTRMLQDAIDRTAGARVPLMLGPGVYRTGTLNLPTGTQIIGVHGATRLVFIGGNALISATAADHITLAGLVLDGAARPMPDNTGLVVINQGNDIRITDCDIVGSSRSGVVLNQISGSICANTIVGAGDVAIHALDSKSLLIQGNIVRDAGNTGILVMRSEKGDDGTLIYDNRIENTHARSGGAGQYGNAINVFRAANVIVRGNHINHAAFSAIRANSASNIQIVGNTALDLGETAIYVEFAYEAAVISSNTVTGAAIGICMANFYDGGRMGVIQGNLIRNLKPKRPAGTDPNDTAGIGIFAEADTAITGNVIENAPFIGIALGWGPYQRDVSVTGNVVRNAQYGISASVTKGAGNVVISGNLIAASGQGAIVGTDFAKPVTGDLSTQPTRFAHLEISGNRVR